MLLLTFEVGSERFATAASDIWEVVPVVELKRIPLAQAWAAGVFDYRGRMTPVVDLCRIFHGQPCEARMSTRIMMVGHGRGDQVRPLGLMAERITRMVSLDRCAFQDAGVAVDEAPYLGGVCNHQGSMLQLVDARRLLPVQVGEQLFRQAAELDDPARAEAQG